MKEAIEIEVRQADSGKWKGNIGSVLFHSGPFHKHPHLGCQVKH